MSKRTCNGGCCAIFPMPKGAIENLELGGNGERDSPFILDMLVPLTKRQAVARAKRFGLVETVRRWFSGDETWEGGKTFTEAYDLYTCRHWDEDTRLCTAYANRPDMCREYPYERECDHADCCYQASKKTRARWRSKRLRREKELSAE